MIKKKKKRQIYDDYWRRVSPDYPAKFQLRVANFRNTVRMLTDLGLNVHRALDIGCADGALVYALVSDGIEAYGVDVSLDAINSSPIRSRLKWCDVDEERLPFPDEYFDLVTATGVFDHLYRPERAMKEAARVLKPGGYLFLTIPAPPTHPVTRMKIFGHEIAPHEPTHVSELPRHAWERMLKENGFELLQIPSFRVFRLLMRSAPLNALLSASAMGPKARYLKLDKAGLIGRIIKFSWEFLMLLYIIMFNLEMVFLARKSPT